MKTTTTTTAREIAEDALTKAWIREEVSRIRTRRERIANEIRETEDAIRTLTASGCPILSGVADEMRERIATLTTRLAEGFSPTQVASLEAVAVATAHAAEAQGLGRAWIREPGESVRRGASRTNGHHADHTLVRVYARNRGGTYHALRGAVSTGAHSAQRQDPRITEIHTDLIEAVMQTMNAAI